MKIVTVVGARPQFVKAAVVSRAFAAHNAAHPDHGVREIIVHTGQHYDEEMSAIFLRELNCPPMTYDLGVRAEGHGAMTGRMLERIEGILRAEIPDAVLVYGDTNSTLAGALAAVKLGIPVAHVEAGMRSYDQGMPEEVNRIMTDRISHWFFCSTSGAYETIWEELRMQQRLGRAPSPVVALVGDVMVDALRIFGSTVPPSSAVTSLLATVGRRFYLTTVHRAENTDDPRRLRDVVTALQTIARETPVMFPLHPRTRGRLETFGISTEGLHVIAPVGYVDMCALLRASAAVFTDSGGLQKEAYCMERPCVTLREVTEWNELVNCGANILAGTSPDRILAAEQRIRTQIVRCDPVVYGDGRAGERIVELLTAYDASPSAMVASGARKCAVAP
ncbi:MAG: UDP-N-acetylglucosamine 2-epimerase (non-hydrolyzing) [bacterium]|nr:UDP-N-acetylglucosamine 2-epimerase (non-hydrolyzing) [bacterium]